MTVLGKFCALLRVGGKERERELDGLRHFFGWEIIRGGFYSIKCREDAKGRRKL